MPGNLIAVPYDGVVDRIGRFLRKTEHDPLRPTSSAPIEAQVWDGGPPRVESLGSLGAYQAGHSSAAGADRPFVGARCFSGQPDHRPQEKSPPSRLLGPHWWLPQH